MAQIDPASPPTSDVAPATDPPGSVRIWAWRPDRPLTREDVADLPALVADPSIRLWIDCVEASPDVITSVAMTLGLHPLVAEDIIERNQRAKIETFDGIVHLVMFALRYEGQVESCEIDIVLGPRFLMTAHDRTWDPTSHVPLRLGLEGVLARGTDYLLYALSDAIVDGYFPVLDRLADEIDQLQDDVMASASEWTLQRLFTLKRELLEIRRATSPEREIFNQLTNRQIAAISEPHILYFRDVYDHLIRVTDELDNYRELVSGTLDIYLTIVNNNLSVIMKRLTGVTVILAGVGAIGGIFGMSEAGAAFSGEAAVGFWIVALGAVAIAAVAAVILRRIDWI